MATLTRALERDVKTPSITIVILGAATLLVTVRSPHEGGYGMCPILAFTGYLCPTCGGLRAVHDLAHLDLAGAWAMNPLLTIALPVAALLIAGWWWRAWRNLPAWQIPPTIVVIGAIVIVGFGILRNF